jgi:zinc protease
MLLLVCLVTSPGCQTSPSQTATSRVERPAGEDAGPAIEFERYQLDNGLTVILHEDHDLPRISVNLWYYVGSKDEEPGRSGFAHLFEHLMFMGTSTVPRGVFDHVIETAGGNNNASTSPDRTDYYENGPANMLETFLFLEADRMKSLGPDMDQERLDIQRGVVRNERRQRFEIEPYGPAFLAYWPMLYPEGHPYFEPVIGSHEDLERATLDDVKSFFAKYYVPANCSLVVAGDFESADAREWIQKHFGPIPTQPAPPRVTTKPVTLDEEATKTIEDQVSLSRTYIVYHSPAFYKPGDADLDIVANVLGQGKTSLLYNHLVTEKKLANDVVAFQRSMELGSNFFIIATAREGVDIEVLEKEIDSTVKEFLEKPIEHEDVDRALSSIEVSFWHEAEDLSARAGLLNLYEYHFDNPGAIQQDRERYQNVTPESAMRWARQVLRSKGRAVLRVVPQAEEETKTEESTSL